MTDDEPGKAPSPAGAQSGNAPLYTIGYGARSLEEFIAALRAHQIEYVLDIRSAPYSRFKPEFTKQMLENALKGQGLKYLFMGDVLGGQPNDPDCYTEGKVDYQKLQAKPLFQTGIERLKKAYQQQQRAVLMCSEGRPEQCHRAKLIGEALAAAGVPVCHIDEDGQIRTQTEVIDRLTHGQLDLFGQPAFTSRKRYTAKAGEEGNRSD